MPAKQKKRKKLRLVNHPGRPEEKGHEPQTPQRRNQNLLCGRSPHGMFPPNAADRHSTNNKHAGFGTLRAGSIKTLA